MRFYVVHTDFLKAKHQEILLSMPNERCQLCRVLRWQLVIDVIRGQADPASSDTGSVQVVWSVSLERDPRRPLFLLGEDSFTEKRSAGERREVWVRENVFLVLDVRGQSESGKGRRQSSSCSDQKMRFRFARRPDSVGVLTLTGGRGRCDRRARLIGRSIGIGIGIIIVRVIGRGSHGVVSHPSVSQLGIVVGARYRGIQSGDRIIKLHRIAAYLETARPSASIPTPMPASGPSR